MLSAISRRAPRRPNQANNGLAAATIGCRLLAVVFQHLIAGRGQLGTILLQASQNGEIALIDHRAAETLHVARAFCSSGVPLRCWATAPVETGIDSRASARKNLCIVFLHSDGRDSRFPLSMTGTDLLGLQVRLTAGRSRAEALANAAKFAAARCGRPGSARRIKICPQPIDM